MIVNTTNGGKIELSILAYAAIKAQLNITKLVNAYFR